jgi:hypothetical protein
MAQGHLCGRRKSSTNHASLARCHACFLDSSKIGCGKRREGVPEGFGMESDDEQDERLKKKKKTRHVL